MTILTEDQIERRVQRFMDHIDRVYLGGKMTNDDYTKAVKELTHWADAKYNELRRSCCPFHTSGGNLALSCGSDEITEADYER